MLVALTELDLALAAVITTAILGIVGAVMTWLVAKQNRQHFTDPAAPAPNPGVVLPSDEETDQLRSRVAAFGSQEMVDLLSEFGEKGACDRSPPGR